MKNVSKASLGAWSLSVGVLEPRERRERNVNRIELKGMREGRMNG